MAHKLYAVSENEYCPSCVAAGHHYRRNQPQHFQLHVPRDRWPESMKEPHAKRVVWEGLVYNADDPRLPEQLHGQNGVVLTVAASEGKDYIAGDSVFHAVPSTFECSHCGRVCGSMAGRAAHERKHEREVAE